MSEMKWTKTCDLKIDSRNFRVVVSEHDNGFYASCLWYEKGRVLKVPGEFGSLQFNPEQRCAMFEAEALALIQQWANDKFVPLVHSSRETPDNSFKPIGLESWVNSSLSVRTRTASWQTNS
ncbi:hypothetical protein P6166_12705 [Stenotrophomonas sp. HITSZ_GD]|uniref:hypothetical protein n=1 Tax=Stenotrophomonas sp. HITSZ_GD TaxID=3037248 RepID=UPI00240D168F|nr:hypothetical protein [Stenotrophomonas sp. HITSZ_GD]MDG2526215.1 hypothetical protein [Stenotrophomonas sp. HITSZ_GD]